MEGLLICGATMMVAVRFVLLRSLWRLPLKHGEEFFFAQRVGPGFYRDAGSSLLQRYHFCLFVPLALDAPVVVWLAATQRLVPLFMEQWLAMIATLVIYNIMAVHFSSRATAMVGNQLDEPPTAVQLSMSPRRLRDHTNWTIEAAIWAMISLALVLLARGYTFAPADGESRDLSDVLQGVAVPIWILYLQFGLMLLKVVFVRWRMPLPARRTEDFRRWRSAWLSYHLKIFDAIRMLCAVLLLSGTAFKLGYHTWSRASLMIAVPGWALVVLVYAIYITRERRRLAVVEREVKPIELVKEFPRRPVPDGCFFGGGLLYFNRDNPVVIVRSAQGIAINLAHPSAYVWAGYFIGLVLLTIWMAVSA
jgi:uncharacterized membrane protein